MRGLKIIVVLVLTIAGVAACGLFGGSPGESPDEKIKRLIDESASFVVFLRDDVTARQRADIEAQIRAVPGVKDVVYESQQQAYERFRSLWSAEPSQPAFIDDVRPESLPSSYEAKMTDAAAARKVRDSPLRQTLESLPGVQQVTFRCTTVEECKQTYSPRPTTSPS